MQRLAMARSGCKRNNSPFIVALLLAGWFVLLNSQTQAAPAGSVPKVTVDSIPGLSGYDPFPVVYTKAQIATRRNNIYNASQDKANLAKGILDITKAPYSATPNDAGNDDWQALQRAVYDAMIYGAACYFPTGTYHITKQISCPMPAIDDGTGKADINATQFYYCVLVGDRSGDRPVIQLKTGASGFDNQSAPKDIFHFWNVYIEDGTKTIYTDYERPNMNFNHRMEYLKIDTTGANNSNAGAAGLYMWGMQGCVIEDVDVDATYSFAGMRAIPGAGGITRGLTVTGGKYGIFADYYQDCGTGNLPQLVGVTLTGQTDYNIYAKEQLEAMTLTGCRLQLPAGSQNNIYAWGSRSFVNVIDSQIERPGSGTAIKTNKGVFLNNVYVQNAATIIDYNAGSDLAGSTTEWKRVNEYGNCDTSVGDTWRLPATLQSIDSGSVSPPTDLISRHWPPETTLPHHDALNVIDVTTSPYNANGADANNDYTAIQNALNAAQSAGKDVFIPKGTFYIDQSLTLPPDVALFGVDQGYSKIWCMGTTFQNENNEIAMLNCDSETSVQASATASVSKIRFEASFVWASGSPNNDTVYDGAYGVLWQYGRKSYIRDALFCYDPWDDWTSRYRDVPWIQITGNGGGRWYNLQRPNLGDSDEMTTNYRQMKVSGTSEPLTFYTLNVCERAWDTQTAIEMVNANNVTIYSLKHENDNQGSPLYQAQALLANNCDNLRIFGSGGNAEGTASLPLIKLTNGSSPVIMSNIMTQYDLGSDPGWDLLSDSAGTYVSPDQKILYYKRGTPSGCAPYFTSNPVVKASATTGTAYSGPTLAGNYLDEDNTGGITFSKISYNLPSGATDWLTIASDGALTGTPHAGWGNVGTNQWTVKVTDGAGLSSLGTMQITVAAGQEQVVTFYSEASYDGWLRESSETSGAADYNDSAGTTITIGDGSLDRQILAILSFDTTSLPDHADISQAVLKMKRASLSGTSPFSWGGLCKVDIHNNGGFSGAASLVNGDFNAAATQSNILASGMSNPTSNGTWSTGTLTGTAADYVSKTVRSQFRIYFSVDDNDNGAVDQMNFYSGNYATQADRPQLVVTYVP